jgi:hypothetical protein
MFVCPAQLFQDINYLCRATNKILPFQLSPDGSIVLVKEEKGKLLY